MCRLFASLSTQSIPAAPYVYEAPQSLSRQSNADRRRLQGDGWGIGSFHGAQVRIFKSPRAMYRDTTALRRAAKNLKTKTLVGHVRWASNPLKLPKSELIGMTHTQPFRYRSWVFAHNGTLYIPREAKALLGPWAAYVKGKNDSEVLFYWLLKYLWPVLHASRPATVDRLSRAVRQGIDDLQSLWKECRTRYPIYRHPFHGMNWVLTNGRLLLAFCYVDPAGLGKSKALAHRSQPYYQLQRNITPEHVTIASEPLDKRAGWTPFRHGELLLAVREKQCIAVKTTLVL